MKGVNEQKKISIAMATYNGGKYLREQLESLYSQTRIPDEVIVCDDNSTDNTVEILEEYKRRKGLKYYVNNPGLGVNKNFEKAIRLCTGDYIAICDQDDVWMSHKIETTLNKLQEIEKGQPACVSSQCLNVNNDMELLYPVRMKRDSMGCEATLLHNGVSQGCSLMFNRELLNMLKQFPDLPFFYDAYIGLVAASVGHKYNISEPLMWYRHHDTNVIARVKDKKPLIKRIVNHLKFRKNDSLVYHQRYKELELILYEYDNQILPEAKDIMTNIYIYRDGNLLKKTQILKSLKTFSCKEKCKILFWQVITSWITFVKL